MTAPSAEAMPCRVLRDEHEIILRVIGVLDRLVARVERGQSFEHEALGRCVEFFRLFADACHHAKEEDLLFPVMELRGVHRDGGPIGVMLEEHRMARAFTKEMANALTAHGNGAGDAVVCFNVAAHRYVDLLRNHIFKEDNVLFNMGDQVLSPEDQTDLHAKFCESSCRSFGGKTREQLAQMADDLETAWPAT